jgi:ribosomal protein S18 acetylase RimI-like enzyme
MPNDERVSMSGLAFDIRQAGPGDALAIERARDLFDAAPSSAATRRFLDSSDHHLLLAYRDEQPVGFVTGVELTHPDKGTEMFLYELGVAEEARHQGIGTALAKALADLARERGCRGMWVLTDEDNAAALAAYRRAGAGQPATQLLLEWQFGAERVFPKP